MYYFSYCILKWDSKYWQFRSALFFCGQWPSQWRLLFWSTGYEGDTCLHGAGWGLWLRTERMTALLWWMNKNDCLMNVLTLSVTQICDGHCVLSPDTWSRDACDAAGEWWVSPGCELSPTLAMVTVTLTTLWSVTPPRPLIGHWLLSWPLIGGEGVTVPRYTQCPSPGSRHSADWSVIRARVPGPESGEWRDYPRHY